MKIIKKKIIKLDKGSVAHMYNKSEKIIKRVSEVYFSNILPNQIKAWKITNSEQLLTVPRGQILLVVKNNNRYKKIRLGYPMNYKALYIKPNTWYGFKCISRVEALICNITSLSNTEAKKDKRDKSYFNFKWNQ